MSVHVCVSVCERACMCDAFGVAVWCCVVMWWFGVCDVALCDVVFWRGVMWCGMVRRVYDE